MSAIWKCRDGRQLPVKDMSTDHVQKTLAMLRRKGFLDPKEAAHCLTNPPSGDHAYDVWEQEMMTLRVNRFVGIFEAELASRSAQK